MSEITLESQLFEIINDEKMPENIKLAKVDMLVKLGVDVNAIYRLKSALMFAKDIGLEKVAEFLEENGAKEFFDEEKAKELGQELCDECEYGVSNIDRVKELVEKGADVNQQNKGGETPLMKASYLGRKEIVELLISNGADVNQQDNEGETSLMLVSRCGGKEIAELLISNGADINVKTEDGWTALMFASREGYMEIVRLLISNGADINIKTEDGLTALMLASCNGHKDTVGLLISKGANINAKDKHDKTPLQYALEYNRIEVAKLLMANGAVIDASYRGRFGSLDSEFQKMIDNAVEKKSKDSNIFREIKNWFER